jgi:hypothetical protein
MKLFSQPFAPSPWAVLTCAGALWLAPGAHAATAPGLMTVTASVLASCVVGTSALAFPSSTSAAIAAGKAMLGNQGGGEITVQGVNGQFRQKDTVAPGNDPTSSKG